MKTKTPSVEIDGQIIVDFITSAITKPFKLMGIKPVPIIHLDPKYWANVPDFPVTYSMKFSHVRQGEVRVSIIMGKMIVKITMSRDFIEPADEESELDRKAPGRYEKQFKLSDPNSKYEIEKFTTECIKKLKKVHVDWVEDG